MRLSKKRVNFTLFCLRLCQLAPCMGYVQSGLLYLYLWLVF